MITRRATFGLGMFAFGSMVGIVPARASDWSAVIEKAKSQTVYFNAWGGDPKINDYLAWAGMELLKRHGVTLNHVKLADTADAVGRIITESESGKTSEGGSIDLIWINGKNFETLKSRDLLHGPFAADLPSFQRVDIEGNPTALMDFTTPVEGYEAPWGTARFVLVHDSGKDPSPPRTMSQLMEFAKANPGRFTYPQPPDFLGGTFLKQLLLMAATNRAIFAKPADDAGFAAASAPLFAFLDALHPLLWREGKAFPANGTTLRTMMSNGELRLIMTFNPAMAANAVLAGELPETVRTYSFEGGSIGNTHFLAIPKNASAKAAAMVTTDFLLSPEAQARKADLSVWGDPTVLAISRLNEAEKALFAASSHPALPDAALLGPMLLEPHPSWGEKLEAAWKSRYVTG